MSTQFAGCIDATATGTLDDASTVCRYDDGAQVTFDAPLPEGMSQFTVERDGTACVRWSQFQRDGEQVVEVTVPMGTATLSGSAATGATLTCPDGSSYVAPSIVSILRCGDPVRYPPATVTSRNSLNLYEFATAIGENADGSDLEVTLYRCMRPGT